MSKVDFGYPYGVIRLPWFEPWRHGWVVEIPASCSAADHSGHPYCDPGWEDRVSEADALVLAGPVLTDSGWRAVVLTQKYMGRVTRIWPEWLPMRVYEAERPLGWGAGLPRLEEDDEGEAEED